MARLKLQAALLWVASLLLVTTPIAAQDLPNLRILPLGDSITKGSGSTDKNGYRKRLRDKLVAYGPQTDFFVDMVGTLKDGNVQDNDHEGHSGKYLRDIDSYWPLSIATRPNVVLIHAGTNNMDKRVELDNCPTLMRSMIVNISEYAPEAVILVAPVIWANDPVMQANTDKFNKEVTSIIEERQAARQRILEVPIEIGLKDLYDKKHPNNQGYQKMADAWFDGIVEAQRRGWLRDPIRMGPDDIKGVGLSFNMGREVGQIPEDEGITPAGCKGGNWESIGTVFDEYRVWEEVGLIRTPVTNGNRNGLILADLNNDGIADYIMVDADGSVRAWINSGRPNQWTSLGKINPSWSGVKRPMVRVADVDNDGRADLIALSTSGVTRVWKNTDDGRSFTLLDSRWATGLKDIDKVQFEDMDGDGFADYVITYNTGAMKWARNTGNNGNDPSQRNWDSEQVIAPKKSAMPSARALIRDLDGDKKSDYLIVYKGGTVKVLKNTGTLDGTAASWEDLGTMTTGFTGVTGDMIRFADMDGDGLVDFLAVEPDGRIRMWRKRSTGVSAASTGTVFCFADLTGSRAADLISVDTKGKVQAWLNKGVGKWESIGDVTPAIPGSLSGARIEFADVNGDGLDDYLIIYNGGAVRAYLNNGNIPDGEKGSFWQSSVTISSGVGQPGHRTRFTDVNGDGYADYIVAFDDGTFYVYINRKNMPPRSGERIWEIRYLVTAGGGQSSNNVVFADITGESRAKYIVQEAGTATAYTETGSVSNAGKPQSWERIGVIASGMDANGAVAYADIDGDGKDDYLVVSESGKVDGFLNTCDWGVEIPAEPLV
ncbi:hypothetical protein ACJ41O_003650 [Fusarium nematophilum]